VNALANAEVGKYVNANFVSAFQKIGTFRLAGDQKQGGNVASYFATPSGRVLHAIAGPVDAGTLLREARWVVETQKLALLEGKSDSTRFKEIFRQAHADRLRQEHNLKLNLQKLPAKGSSAALMGAIFQKAAQQGGLSAQGRVHLLMVAAPLARIGQVYKLVFEKVLGEKVSTSPVTQTR
jgi:hypothetical protein